MATARSGLFAIPDHESLVVAGRPGTLRASLPLMNTGDAPVAIRGSDVRVAVALEERAHPTRLPVSLRAVLQPGQAAAASLRLEVDPHTPPGEYVGEIELAGSTRRLVLTITERFRLAIDPSPVVLEGVAGATIAKTVVFRNRGNVPLHIRDPGPVAIGEELPFSPAVTAEVAATGRADAQVGELLGKLLGGRETRLLKDAGILTVRLSGGGFTLAPGAVVSVTAECALPAELLPHRRYRAYAPIYDADLEFLITAGKADRKQRVTSKHARS